MSKLPWLRLYTDTVDNEKLRLLAFEDRWHYIAILCLKQQGLIDEPESELRTRKIAVKLGVQVRELDEISRRLLEVGLVDSRLDPTGWENKQFSSDSSSDRVRKYRENKKKQISNVTETLQKRNSNVIDTDTDTDTEKKPAEKNPAGPPKKQKFNDQDLEHAKYFLWSLRKLNPEHKQPNLENWADVFRLMRERDNRQDKQIQIMIEFCHTDDFWKSNILSPSNLRKHWDRLAIQKGKAKPKTTQFANSI